MGTIQSDALVMVSITELAEDTPTGKLFEATIESLDEFYSANLGEEVTCRMRESASNGFYISAQAPFDYRKVRINDGGKKCRKKVSQPLFTQRVS